MNAKHTKTSPIHENADSNITCDFGDGDISRYRSRFPHTRPDDQTETRPDGHIVSSIIVRYIMASGVRVIPYINGYLLTSNVSHQSKSLIKFALIHILLTFLYY